jgi:acetylornithine/succinyldiaminopimelate/putrescine aminotransferase
MSLQQRDRKFVGREHAAEDLQVVRTDGTFVYDRQGKKYIDFLAGWCVGNFGWGNDSLRRKLVRRGRPDYIYPYHLYEPWVELAELLAEITPGKLQVSYRATGGTEAVDIALQIAMAHTRRRKFVSLENSYHGNSIGTVSIGASENREAYPNLLSNCLKISAPLDQKAAERLERLLKNRDVAAVILEPISCNLGVLIPEDTFMARLPRLCRKYGTLLISDEVATGFGRTGRLFASEHFDLEPDILCMAKALSGGYAPIGATITTARIAKSIEGNTGFYSTYGWHPAATDVAIANVRWLVKHWPKLQKHVAAVSESFRERLADMKWRSEPELRIRGMAIGVDVGDKEYASRIEEKCGKNGLLLTTADTTLTMFPALTIEQRVVDEGLDILERVVRRG